MKLIKDLGLRYPYKKCKQRTQHGLYECPRCLGRFIRGKCAMKKTKHCTRCAMFLKKRNKYLYGVGLNDASYPITKTINKKVVWCCPFYNSWKHMITRVFSKKYHKKQPTYIDTTICSDWLTFSNYKLWMESQD